jgi:hypothetical protein
VFATNETPIPVHSDPDIVILAEALREAAKAVSVTPQEKKDMLTVKADNVTISNPDAATALDRMSAALERMSVVVNVPQQDAPVVNITNPITVEPASVTVTAIPAPTVENKITVKPADVIMPEKKKRKVRVNRDNNGAMTGLEEV